MALARYEGQAVDDFGNVLASPTIQVNSEADGALAALKSDRDGLVVNGNSFTGEVDGSFAFYVVGGAYRITITKDSLSKTLRYVPIGTAAEYDIEYVSLAGLLVPARVVDVPGDVTILSSDSRVHVKKTVEAATNVNFMSVAAWVTANGQRPFSLKNRMSNPALYPLYPILSGTDTIEDSNTPLPQDSRVEVKYFPDFSVTPNNWEIL